MLCQLDLKRVEATRGALQLPLAGVPAVQAKERKQWRLDAMRAMEPKD